jgi:MOSC domain-containing protein
MAMTIASVASLWRYPVKSMMGEELGTTLLGEQGLIGDRSYALIDRATGKVASAKNPRKWPEIFKFSATLAAAPEGSGIAPVQITTPDGKKIISGTDEVDRVLSRALDRQVTLQSQVPETPSLEQYWPDMEDRAQSEKVTDEAMPPTTFFDCGMVHLITAATLKRLSEFYPAGKFELRRFRPNIFLDAQEEGFVENSWVGRTLAIGPEVRLLITQKTGRCVMTTLPQGNLPRDLGILRYAAQHNEGHVGVYATVVSGGTISRGDAVSFA